MNDATATAPRDRDGAYSLFAETLANLEVGASTRRQQRSAALENAIEAVAGDVIAMLQERNPESLTNLARCTHTNDATRDVDADRDDILDLIGEELPTLLRRAIRLHTDPGLRSLRERVTLALHVSGILHGEACDALPDDEDLRALAEIVRRTDAADARALDALLLAVAIPDYGADKERKRRFLTAIERVVAGTRGDPIDHPDAITVARIAWRVTTGKRYEPIAV